uniref:Uncharacterized protein n=1 Tax=Trichogramma kaykai TaxID=54128 RepID=A0ABD2WIP4_9HYME
MCHLGVAENNFISAQLSTKKNICNNLPKTRRFRRKRNAQIYIWVRFRIFQINLRARFTDFPEILVCYST